MKTPSRARIKPARFARARERQAAFEKPGFKPAEHATGRAAPGKNIWERKV